ncbi:MAG: N-acetylglucosamine-6-phosphate deacetylase [Armatimonadetes bacterium]|nr:N-acetylglucosamine-6-phosphate deacetylase [Armatimonadota bacterium]MDE2206914.1 N-acetylglucosamine-6-phosphate deacetylase [Armatimonadota bacterium]
MQSDFSIRAGMVLEPDGPPLHDAVIRVSHGRITEIVSAAGAGRAQIDAPECLAAPGFIDIHVHGGGGAWLMDGAVRSLEVVSRHLAQHGVTAYLVTTVTSPWDQHANAVAAARRYALSHQNGRDGAAVLGCHLEGPFINPLRKGAQPEAFIRPPSIAELESALGSDIEFVRIVTLAPEMVGAGDLIAYLGARGIVSSIGHTDATAEQVFAAVELGARHVTHCYNAMRGLSSRDPGVVGAAMAHPALSAELIWDNIHVHPTACMALVRAKGSSGIMLISDGIPGSGMADGYRFSLGGLKAEVREGAARLPDGTLAGSLLTLDVAWRNAGILDLQARTAMTSANAARAIGMAERKGALAPGRDADIVLLNQDGNVEVTIVAGRVVYAAPGFAATMLDDT